MSFVSTKLGQFRYFDQQLGSPDWKGKRILDFGGNCGNLLKDPKSPIDEDKYWCIDVSRDGVSQGQQDFPRGHWIFYDRHNFQFNPTGVRGLKVPDTEQEFDFILAYSVFTHTDKAEMIELVEQLRSILADSGVLAFTFFDARWHAFNGDPFPGSNLEWRLRVNKGANPEMDIESLLDRSTSSKWVTLVDDKLFVDEENGYDPGDGSLAQKAYIVFCDPDYMRTIFPDSEVLPPAAPERHHCCILRKKK